MVIRCCIPLQANLIHLLVVCCVQNAWEDVQKTVVVNSRHKTVPSFFIQRYRYNGRPTVRKGQFPQKDKVDTHFCFMHSFVLSGIEPCPPASKVIKVGS